MYVFRLRNSAKHQLHRVFQYIYILYLYILYIAYIVCIALVHSVWQHICLYYVFGRFIHVVYLHTCSYFSRCGLSKCTFPHTALCICVYAYFTWCIRNSGIIKNKCWRWEWFVVLCDSVQGAIVETISQLFSLACDRLVSLMWERRTSPSSLPPSPQAHSAWGWLLSQQEGKVSAWLWHQNKRESKIAGEG